MTASDNIWTRFAVSYDRVLGNWSEYQRLSEEMRRHLPKNGKILDVGCGTGLIAIPLTKDGCEVHGIDNNDEMLARARLNAGSALGTSMHLDNGDAEELAFADSSFDGVIANNVIFYVASPARMISEVRRVLKPSGVFAVSGPTPHLDMRKLIDQITREFRERNIYDELKDDLEHFVACSAQLKATGMPNVYWAAQLEALLLEAGFDEVLTSREDLYLGESYLVVVR